MQVFLSGDCLNTTSYDGVQSWRKTASLRAMGSEIGAGWGGNTRPLTGTTRGDENGRDGERGFEEAGVAGGVEGGDLAAKDGAP